MGLMNVAALCADHLGRVGRDRVGQRVASVLNSTVPFFSVLISGLILQAEAGAGMIAGLLVGLPGLCCW